MGYNFYQKFGVMQAMDAERLVKQAIKLDWSFNEYQSRARDAGLSFRREEMQYDYRRAQAIEKAKSYESKAKVETWFESVFEPMRTEKGWTSKQATAAWEEMQRKVFELEELTEEEETWEEIYEEALW